MEQSITMLLQNNWENGTVEIISTACNVLTLQSLAVKICHVNTTPVCFEVNLDN